MKKKKIEKNSIEQPLNSIKSGFKSAPITGASTISTVED